VVFAGRGLSTTSQRGASQEIPTDRVFEPVTKWSIRIDRAELVPEVLHQAFTKARGGRPGPVYIDIPRDVLGEQVSFTYRPAGAPSRPQGDPAEVAELVDRLLAAERPILIAGGGTTMAGAH